MNRGDHVLLGLSGGVDSAVAATLLRKEGYRVTGHFLNIGLGGEADARMVAKDLGIAFSVGDVREALETNVCEPFAAEYLSGRTPSPCARCNPTVKFPALFSAAKACGARYVATGHYVRTVREEGAVFLHRGLPANDQSYLLARLPKSFLPQILFPLGGYEKTAVRDLARDFGISVAEKPDSMEICFIPDGDYGKWLDRRGKTPKPGNFVSTKGDILGQHKGIHHYTLGQRRGLGIASTGRLFVSALRPERDEVVLSHGEDLHSDTVLCHELNLLAPVTDGQAVGLRIRHSKEAYPATITLREDRALLHLARPARAPTPGQLAVFYEEDRVLGSGWIE